MAIVSAHSDVILTCVYVTTYGRQRCNGTRAKPANCSQPTCERQPRTRTSRRLRQDPLMGHPGMDFENEATRLNTRIA